MSGAWLVRDCTAGREFRDTERKCVSADNQVDMQKRVTWWLVTPCVELHNS